MTTNAHIPSSGRIQRDAVLLYISQGRLRTRRKVDPASVETDIDKSLLHISKDILTSKELEEIGSFDSAVRNWVRVRCLPSPLKGKGVYILPVRLIESVLNYLEQAKRDRQPLIDTFCSFYEQRKLEAKPKLGTGFNEADYPAIDRVRSAFTFDVQVWTLETPGQLSAINRDLYQREVARMDNMWKEATRTVSGVLCSELQKLTARLAERLAPSEDGKRKIFRDSVVTNLTEWLDLFDARNLGDDTELAKVVEKAKKLIKGIDPETIRDSDHLRMDLEKDFSKLSSKLDELAVDRPLRAIDLDFDGAA